MPLRIRVLAALVLTVLAGDVVVAYRNVTALITAERTLTSSHFRLTALESFMSTVKDAETGQRGYLITGDDAYLEPYNEATASVDQSLRSLRNLWPPDDAERLSELERLVAAKRTELQATIDVRRTAGAAAAQALVRQGQGKQQMDAIRGLVSRLRSEEEQRLSGEAARSAAARRTALATVLVAGAIATMSVLVCVWLLQRELAQEAALARERERARRGGGCHPPQGRVPGEAVARTAQSTPRHRRLAAGLARSA